MPREQKQLQKERKFRKVEAPDFYKFANLGDKIEGTLVEKGRSENYSIGLYALKQDSGDTMRIHGSADLDSKMTGVSVGQYVTIEWVDNKPMEKGKTPMKIFDVQVAE